MIATAIACYAAVLINLTKEPWNAKDAKIIRRAEHVCATDYRHAPEFPCVKSVTKKRNRHYSVICGVEKF
jgi:hypothetical protein